jgi:3-methylfumaryl-CoA hydratase
MSESLEHLRQWVGRQQTHHDLATAWPIAALNATLNRQEPEPKLGQAIPLGWHWLYFLETATADELAHDGHPKRGGFLPPVSLPRRMWAGGRIEFLQPILIGENLTRVSEILNVEPKSGKSGDLVFVTVRHTISGNNQARVVEEHDIVYREAAKPGAPSAPAKPAPTQPTWQQSMTPNEAMLFRYSALTFNSHRIHYDLDYCRSEEGYPGLVVHGPLQTTLLLELHRNHGTQHVKKLEYRAVSPIFHNQTLTVGGIPSADGKTVQVWTAGAQGQIAMSGTIHY